MKTITRIKYLFITVMYLWPAFLFAQTGIENPLSDINSLTDLINVILSEIVIPIGSVIVVLAIIWSGFLFVKARGNPSKINEAKNTLIWTLIGSAILLGAVVISEVISGTLCEIFSGLPGCE